LRIGLAVHGQDRVRHASLARVTLQRDSEAVLRDLAGCDDAEIATLRAEGVTAGGRC
jgi:hypothetical protein